MDIVIDIQGFRDAEGKFMPKEVAVVAINEAFISHCIMMPPYPFVELPEKYEKTTGSLETSMGSSGLTEQSIPNISWRNYVKLHGKRVTYTPVVERRYII
ncbi:hypothetical protein P5V15_015041 [Pogonomyrmex californicus]